MNDLLARRHREILARFAWSNVLLAFDFDGTLAPITARPADSKMRAATASKLARLARVYPVAIISGRSYADITQRLRAIPGAVSSGNHGLEPGGDLARYRRLVRRWRASLEVALRGLPGVELEDKTYSLSIHYRRSREKRKARAIIAAAVAALGGSVRAIAGKLVLNVVPVGAPHKGQALRRLREELGADTAIYVGDDVTDEDVFALQDPGLLGVRVGRARRSAASWYVDSQQRIDALLDRLLALRRDARQERRQGP